MRHASSPARGSAAAKAASVRGASVRCQATTTGADARAAAGGTAMNGTPAATPTICSVIAAPRELELYVVQFSWTLYNWQRASTPWTACGPDQGARARGGQRAARREGPLGAHDACGRAAARRGAERALQP